MPRAVKKTPLPSTVLAGYSIRRAQAELSPCSGRLHELRKELRGSGAALRPLAARLVLVSGDARVCPRVVSSSSPLSPALVHRRELLARVRDRVSVRVRVGVRVGVGVGVGVGLGRVRVRARVQVRVRLA